MTLLVLRECSTCGGLRAFEVPVCADGHGADCPDLACVECGTAIFVGAFPALLAEHSAGRVRVAPAA